MVKLAMNYQRMKYKETDLEGVKVEDPELEPTLHTVYKLMSLSSR